MEVEVEEAISVREPVSIMFNGKPLNNKKALKPLKIIVYGDNGVGKSYFAGKSKNPIFFDLEGNIEHLPADEWKLPEDAIFHKERITSFAETENMLQILINKPHEFKTLIIDSLDTLYSLCMKKIKSSHKLKELSYGLDHRLCAQEFVTLCETLGSLREKRGMSIVLLAHSRIKTVQNPLVTVYDRIESTLSESVFRILLDWASGIFYAFKDKDTKKRWLYTDGNEAYLAKNIYNLPQRIDMDWDSMTKTILKNFEGKNDVTHN